MSNIHIFCEYSFDFKYVSTSTQSWVNVDKGGYAGVAVINANGLGPGAGSSSSRCGGAYGYFISLTHISYNLLLYSGSGGSVTNTSVSVAYGSIFRPVLKGSSGSSAAIAVAGGNGGGVIIINAESVTINGNISSNAGDGASGSSGGIINYYFEMVMYLPYFAGAGGSILIITINVSGNGFLTANGGEGSARSTIYGGGGR